MTSWTSESCDYLWNVLGVEEKSSCNQDTFLRKHFWYIFLKTLERKMNLDLQASFVVISFFILNKYTFSTQLCICFFFSFMGSIKQSASFRLPPKHEPCPWNTHNTVRDSIGSALCFGKHQLLQVHSWVGCVHTEMFSMETLQIGVIFLAQATEVLNPEITRIIILGG